MTEYETKTEATPESEHPEMERAAREVAALIPAGVAGDIPAPSEDDESECAS